MSPAARNWFFGTNYFDYYAPPTSLYARYRFLPAEATRGLLAEKPALASCSVLLDPPGPGLLGTACGGFKDDTRPHRDDTYRIAAGGLLCALPLAAHVGSPDVFYEGEAGPYHLLVTIRPPQVVPGVAEIEIRSASPDVQPDPHRASAADRSRRQFAPVPDLAQRSKDDPQFYTGAVAHGHGILAGARGGGWSARPGMLSVPVPALPRACSRMQKGLAAILVVLGLVLFVGLVSIVGAAVREANWSRASSPMRPACAARASRWARPPLVLPGAVWLGSLWWNSEAG